ncbi:ABC transporter ATP-binding protein [Krasilnikovia sp. MM14-A1259]|uniref:ABC transporter ATP-binding protein n=1 Tax=Krasilnikovia sp. MM14-A1259 TaxID=3373539 RepID=UPI003810F37F
MPNPVDGATKKGSFPLSVDRYVTVDSTLAISVRDLKKSYPGVEAVQGVSFEVARGQVFGLIGPNGAGKTTTLECLVGLRKPTAGVLRILGRDPSTRASRLRHVVAVQPQEGALFAHLKVRETVQLWSTFYQDPLPIEPVLTEVGLTDQANQRVKALSGGQRRRLLLAVCLVGNPEVLVLDEPASGLDPSARELLWDVIRSRRSAGSSVLLTTHDMNEATQLCDQIGVLVGGRIVASGSPAQLARDLGGFSTVSFTTQSPHTIAAVRRLPAVASVRTEAAGGRTQVYVKTKDGDDVVRHIASTADIEASDLTITHGGLDDVFKTLVASADGRTEQTHDHP